MAVLQRFLPGAGQVRPHQRRSRNTQAKTAACSRRNGSYDFLTQTLLPVSTIKPPLRIYITQAENSFAKSLDYMCRLYSIAPIALSNAPFPINIYQAFNDVKDQMKARDDNLELLIVGDMQSPKIATAQPLNIGYDLFYVPLEPTRILFSKKETTPLANLVLSAFNYLYECGAALCNNGSFVGYEMEIIRDSFDDYADEIDIEELKEMKQEASNIIDHCAILCSYIADPHLAIHFDDLLEKIIPRSQSQRQLVKAINQLHQLKTEFPGRRFTDHIFEINPKQPNDQIMCPDQYFSFFWGGDSAFEEQLAGWIDSSLQEMTGTQTPVALQVFDRPHPRPFHDVEFESRLLNCVTEINSALYAITHQ